MNSTKNESNQDTQYAPGPMPPTENEAARGLRFMHLVLLAVERQEQEATGMLEGIHKLLIDKGITNEAEWQDALNKPVGS